MGQTTTGKLLGLHGLKRLRSFHQVPDELMFRAPSLAPGRELRRCRRRRRKKSAETGFGAHSTIISVVGNPQNSIGPTIGNYSGPYIRPVSGKPRLLPPVLSNST